MGCNAFDTARVYRSGESERVPEGWVAERAVRDQAILITKGAHPDLSISPVDPRSVAADIHASLQALRTDRVDLYVLHRDEPSSPVGPIVEVLNEQRAAGKVVAFGASHWEHRRDAAALYLRLGSRETDWLDPETRAMPPARQGASRRGKAESGNPLTATRRRHIHGG